MRPVPALVLLLALAPGPAAGDDWAVRRTANDPRLVEQYLSALRRDPEDAAAWRRLLGHYRRHGGLVELERRLERETRTAPSARRLLARLARERGDLGAARRHLETALGERPTDATLLLALADLLLVERQIEPARALLRQADAAEGPRSPRRRRILAPLADLARAAGDLPAARGYLEALAGLTPKDHSVKLRLAEVLARQGDHPAAKQQLAELARDRRASVDRRLEAYRRLVAVEEEAGQTEAARQSCRQALALLGEGDPRGLELDERLIALHRRDDRLPALIAEAEAHPAATRSGAAWTRLGRLKEEVGDLPGAIEAHRRALARDRHSFTSRRQLVRLYDRTGRPAEAVAELTRLVDSAPGEPRFQIELAERLGATGEGGAAKARAILDRLARRRPNEPTVHAALAELFRRSGDLARAQREQELLARLEPDDDGHLIALGELHDQRGEREWALAVWRRLLDRPGGRPARLARLAAVLGEHELVGEAVELQEQAAELSPNDLTIRRDLARLYERRERVDEAQGLWELIYERAAAPSEHPLRDEARRRLLALAEEGRELPRQIARFGARFRGPPRAPAWALLAAEGWLRLGEARQAEKLLEALRADGGTVAGEAELGLAKVATVAGRPLEAMAALERAAPLLPERRREILGRAVEIAEAAGREGDALRLLRGLAVTLPTDAQLQARLAGLLDRSGDDDGAVEAYRRALTADPKAPRAALDLARLLLRRGEIAAALAQFREIALHGTDEAAVVEGLRRSVELADLLGGLGELERSLGGLASTAPLAPAYRPILLDLYRRRVAALQHRPAGDEIRRLGARALSPLLEALGQGTLDQRRQAIALLAALGVRGAAGPLVRLAQPGRNAPPAEIRSAALRAAAVLEEPEVAPLLPPLLADPEVEVRAAAVAAAGSLPDASLRQRLVPLLDDAAPSVQAAACLALERGASAALPRLRGLLRRHEEPAEVRAAAALAVARLDDRGALPDLEQLVLSPAPSMLRAVGLWSLAALGGRQAEPTLLRLALLGDPALRPLAGTALVRLALAHRQPFATHPDWPMGSEPGEVTKFVTQRLAPPTPAERQQARATWAADDAFLDAAAAALSEALATPGRAAQALLPLAPGHPDRGPALAPLLDGEADGDATRLRRRLTDRLVPALTRLAAEEATPLRRHAVRLLCFADGEPATDGCHRGLRSGDPALRRAALAGLAALGARIAVPPDLAAQLLDVVPWADRPLATIALARAARSDGELAALGRVADDGDPLLRLAIANGLAQSSLPATALLLRLAADPLPVVRGASVEALGRREEPAARQAIRRLVDDPDPAVRALAATAAAAATAPASP